MAPRDANIGGVERDRAAAAKAKKKKVVVKRKPKPPLLVPSMRAELLVPHEKPAKPAKPKTIMDKRKPAAPKPVRPQFQYAPMRDIMLPPKPGSLRAKQIEKYNQDTERERRAAARAQREAEAARRKEVRGMDPRVRGMLGKERIDRYIKEGTHESVGALVGHVAEAVGRGAAKLPERTFRAASGTVGGLQGRLSAGVRQREHEDIAPEDNALVGGASELVVGHNLVNALQGDDYDLKGAALELGLLTIPIKGAPTAVTAVLRAVIGTTKLAQATRAGLTVAEAAQTLTRPISEVRAAKALRLKALADDATIEGPIPSSKIAGKLAGSGTGKLARVVRNDVRAKRNLKMGNATVPVDADLSRIGKGVRAGMDRIRDYTLVPLRSQETLAARQIGREANKYLDRAAGREKALELALPKHLLKMDWPGIYAVRAVAKGVPIEDLIRVTERNMVIAREAGNWLQEEANKHHLAYFQAARKYVTTDANGKPIFTPDAPANLPKLTEALGNVSMDREALLGGLDKLSDDVAMGRILKEQMYYAEARALPKDEFYDEANAAHPIRQEVEALWRKHNPAQADNALRVIDANARRIYQQQVADFDKRIKDLEDGIARNPLAPQNARNRRWIEELEAERDALSPAAFFDQINDVSDVLPPEIIARIEADRGTMGDTWRFSMYDSEDEVAAASRRMADEIVAEGLPLPPEWDTPEKISDGIHNVFKLARDGERGKDWYQEAADGVEQVAEVTGEDPRKVAQLFAIYSQAADTIANATFVFKAIREYQNYGDIFTGRFPVRQSEEALSVMKGLGWDGRKRSSFYANMLRHMPGQEEEYKAVIKELADERGAPVKHPVTVDRWVVRMFRPDAKKDVPEKYYDTFEAIMQKMAAHVGWEPEQVQAAAWVTTKQMGFDKEIADAGGKVKGTLTARLAAGAEDPFRYGIGKNIDRWNEWKSQPVGPVTPQHARLANQANKKWGGFTVHPDLTPVPEEGYSVSWSLTERGFKLHGLKGDDIQKFREDYAELLKDKRNAIGGFSDDLNEAGDGTELTLLSVTRHFKTKASAMKFAREQGQETVYEYKTGDGIRTGLTRYEQGDIIRALDTETLKGGPRGGVIPPTPEEKAYQEFLDRAAVETGHAKPNKKGEVKVTPAQRSRTEQWLSKNAKEYADEPLIQEWYDMTATLPEDLPPWMLEPPPSEVAAVVQKQVSESQLHYSLFGEDGEILPSAEAVLTGEGAQLARAMPGHDQAIADLEAGILPTAFIEAVYNSPLHVYKKTAIGAYLNVASNGALRGRGGSPAMDLLFPQQLSLMGLWEGASKGLYFSERAHPVDWIHEFTHALETADMFPPKTKDILWEHVGAQRNPDGTWPELDHDQSEDLADFVTSSMLFNIEESTLPVALKQALTALQRDLKASGRDLWREEAALAKLPEEERVFIEDIYRYDEAEFTNGFTPKTGSYVPEKLGVPFRFGEVNPLAPRRAASIWLRLLSGKRIVTMTPTDAHLTHEFKAELLQSGIYEKNVIEGPMEGLYKALHLKRMHEVHQTMVAAGRPIPQSENDIMIPISPTSMTDKTKAKVRNVAMILNTMDSGGTIDDMALNRVDAQAIENVKDYLFPGLTNATSDEVTKLAREAMQVPIKEVVWVDRNLLLKTGLFAPKAVRSRKVKYAVGAVDTLNNALKMMTLSLNPSYYPMNMAGQSIMLASQLGFSAPFSLYKSLGMAHRMSEEDLALVDRFADIGYAGSLLSKGGVGKSVVDAVGKVGTVLIDKYPRRFSFLHEARRLGYKSDARVSRLLNDPELFDDLMTVHTRVQRAMVDYGNLNDFEKDWLTRLIFVYPWLRGSSRYAAQFPFDHPIQAALFAGLVYWQQNRLQEYFPEGHPGYMKWFVPIGQAEGENPYGFRMDQLATPLQTLDLASMMTYWGTGGKVDLPWGSNEEGMSSMLGPLAEEIEKTITGWDSFAQQEVSHGLPQMFMRILDPRERWASWKRLEKVMNHETHKGLYDTTQTQNWLRLFLGSLTPMNVDTGKAEEMAEVQRGNPSPKQSRDKYIEKIEEVGGKPLSPEERATIEKWKTADQAYNKVTRAYRDDNEVVGDSTIQQRAAILLLTVGEINPAVKDEVERRAALALQASDEEAQAAVDELRVALGLKQLGTLNGRIQSALTEQNKAKQEAA